ncbi:MAG: glycosyltransferase family 4 protein [Xanthomonadales bacterium]|nr:glycosyltransferase family 4 protein [Xanthomonadales bacterium]
MKHDSPIPSLLVIATHPIQYQAPLFRALAASGICLTVGFLDLPDPSRQGVGFAVGFSWDVPLTEGFSWVKLDGIVADGAMANTFGGRRWRRPIVEVRKHSPDAVMVMGWNQLGLLQAWLAAKWCGIPLIVRGDSNAKRGRPRWKRWLHRLLLSLPLRYVAVGASNTKFYLDSGVPTNAIALAPHFVDNTFFSSRAASCNRASERAKRGASPEDFCILFAGKFESKKRPADLLAAVASLPVEARARIHILMVGAGPLEADLRLQAEAVGLRVSWAGFLNQTEIPAAYAAADVLVLPSDNGETWGLVVNEAMACGVPAIVSDQVGCADDLVRHGQTGLVFPMGDIPALGSAISEMASTPERRRAMGEAARSLVTSEYTIERSVEAIVDAVYQVTGRQREGRGAAIASE